MTRARELVLGQAPHIYHPQSTASLTWGTAAALLPAALWGAYSFGPAVGLAVAASVLAALIGEAFVGLLLRRFTLGDGSAFLTGLLIGLAMPPGVPLFIPVAASLFAVMLVKGSFGGLGSNWMNPALGGIVFALLDWPRQMGAWFAPRSLAGVVGVSGATPLSFVKQHALSGQALASPLSLLHSSGLRFSDLDHRITDLLNLSLFGKLGSDLPGGYVDLLVGNKAGSPGELSAVLILIASIVLLSRRMIRWEVPASMVGGFALLTWVFGGLPFGSGFFSGDVLFSLLTGSFLLVAFFMATDPVTSPSTRSGMIIYGLGIAAVTYLIRTFSSLPEGSAFAVLIMNCLTPMLGRRSRRGGTAEQLSAGDL